MGKELFNKYLQGECTPEEFEILLAWIKEKSETKSGKNMVEQIWNEFESAPAPESHLRYARILDKIHHEININQNTATPLTRKVIPNNKLFIVLTRVAAILLFPVLLALIYTNFSSKNNFSENSNDIEVIAPSASKIQFVLGDGTKVWLNHGSKLKYPLRFDGKIRKVNLSGEAFFEVAHNKEVPFVVETNELEVKATGTAFNVAAYPDDNSIETTLIEGKVIVIGKNKNKEIPMVPSECVRFSLQTRAYVIEKNNTEKYVAWKDGLLIFKNDPMEIVAKKLARWYNVDIVITDERINELTYTATFSDESLPQILDLMGLATPLKYELSPSVKLADGRFSKRKVSIGLNGK